MLAPRIDLQGIAAWTPGLAPRLVFGCLARAAPVATALHGANSDLPRILAFRPQGVVSAAHRKAAGQSRSLTTIGRILFTPRSSRAAAPE